jgi:predicted Rossmann fold nucleotide-binding protein DprA/Smf involved in DNA uptake
MSLSIDTIVVSGGCRGVDSWAAEAAHARGLKVETYPPELPDKGSPKWAFVKAYHARNKMIAENCDRLVAFVSEDRTGGTENTIKWARAAGVPVEVR